jgi:hypothetical protein
MGLNFSKRLKRNFQGLEYDFRTKLKKLEERLETSKKELEQLEKNSAPESLIKFRKGMIYTAEKEIKEIQENKKQQLEIFYSFMGMRFPEETFWKGQDNKIKSYLFSTLPRKKLFKRLSEILPEPEPKLDLKDIIDI